MCSRAAADKKLRLTDMRRVQMNHKDALTDVSPPHALTPHHVRARRSVSVDKVCTAHVREHSSERKRGERCHQDGGDEELHIKGNSLLAASAGKEKDAES